MSPNTAQISVLFLAFVLLLLFSISLPSLPALCSVRVTFGSGSEAEVVGTTGLVSQLRFGIWGFCSKFANGTSVCTKTGPAYALAFNSGGTAVAVGANWTRGLVIHAVATGVTFVALLVACCAHSGTVPWLALATTFIALWPHIALYQHVWHKLKNTAGVDTELGYALAMHFAAAFLLLLAAVGGTPSMLARRRDLGGRSLASMMF